MFHMFHVSHIRFSYWNAASRNLWNLLILYINSQLSTWKIAPPLSIKSEPKKNQQPLRSIKSGTSKIANPRLYRIRTCLSSRSPGGADSPSPLPAKKTKEPNEQAQRGIPEIPNSTITRKPNRQTINERPTPQNVYHINCNMLSIHGCDLLHNVLLVLCCPMLFLICCWWYAVLCWLYII